MPRLNWGEISVHGQRTRIIHEVVSWILGDATSGGRYSAPHKRGGGRHTTSDFVDARSASTTPRVTGNPELPSMHLSLPRETLEAFRGTQHSYIPQHATQSKTMQTAACGGLHRFRKDTNNLKATPNYRQPSYRPCT